MAKETNSLLEKAIFVSGRDATSIGVFSDVLQRGESPMVKPGDVALVRDPVLSDSVFTDDEGTCWKQSEGVRLSFVRARVRLSFVPEENHSRYSRTAQSATETCYRSKNESRFLDCQPLKDDAPVSLPHSA